MKQLIIFCLLFSLFVAGCSGQNQLETQPTHSPSSNSPTLPPPAPSPRPSASPTPTLVPLPVSTPLPAPSTAPVASPTPVSNPLTANNLVQLQNILPFDLSSLAGLMAAIKPNGGSGLPALPSLLPPAFLSIAFSPDGKTLALGGCTSLTGGAGLACLPPASPVLRLVDTQTGQILKELTGPTSSITSLVFTPDGKTLITASEMKDGNIRFWDVASGSLLKSIPIKSKIGNPALALTPDGSALVVAWSQNFQVLDLASQQVLAKGVSSNGIPRFNQDGSAMAIFGADDRSSIAIYDPHSWKLTTKFSIPPQTLQFALSPDGRLVVTSGEGDSNNIHFWDVSTGKELGVVKDDLNPSNLAFTPDGKTLLVAGIFKGAKYSLPLKMMSFWDPATLKLTGELRAPNISPRVLALTADGQRLAYADMGGTVAVWGPPDDSILAARKVLLAYLDDLNQGNYTNAAALFYATQIDPASIDYKSLKKSQPKLDLTNLPSVLQAVCSDKRFPCAKFRDFVYQGSMVSGGITFYVEFAAPDGSALVSPVPCKQVASTCQPATAFQFNLLNSGGDYKLVSLPPAAQFP